jgi:penicillin-binding protein 2
VSATEERVLSPELARHLRTIRAMMSRVVEGPSGTGRRGGVDSLHVAGKTGTAQNPHGEDHALFVAFAPAEAPEVALVVVVERRGHGGTIAAPVAHEFWQAYKEWRRSHEELVG